MSTDCEVRTHLGLPLLPRRYGMVCAGLRGTWDQGSRVRTGLAVAVS